MIETAILEEPKVKLYHPTKKAGDSKPISKKRIVLFADVLEENFDGVSVTLTKILHSVPRDRFEYLVITSHPPKNTKDFPHKLVILPYLKIPMQKGYRLGLPRDKELKQVLDEFKPDLIHFTSPSLFGGYAIKYGKKNKIPVLNIYHTHYPAYIKYYIGWLGDQTIGRLINMLAMWYYKNSNITLAPTRMIKMDLIKRGVPADTIKVWGRAIKTNSFSPEYRDEKYFDGLVPKGNKKVLFVSRLIKEKEMTTIVKVYRLLQKKVPNVTMVITGDGPERAWLEEKMPNAVFTGKKTGLELSKIYASCDLFFFPSASETFGNVVIEAMASGLPVVAANAGGPAELVRDNKTGYLVNTGNAKMFCNKIIEVLKDPAVHAQMSANGQTMVRPKTIESLHDQLWRYYETTIENYQSA